MSNAITGTPTVAFLGPRGTFTEQALHDLIAAGHLPVDCRSTPVHSPRIALDKVRAGEADYAVVALESVVDGPVAQTEDALANGSRLQVIRETLVPIVFSILVRPGTQLQDIKTFTTHPVAEAQVRSWVRDHLHNVDFIPASSNAAAAQAVAEGKADAAAAPARAGELFALEALAEGVADMKGAFTRFVLVRQPGEIPARTGDDRTGVIFTLKNEPSSLMTALAELATRGVDMSRISSRPTHREGSPYSFHVGIVGHIEDDSVAEALAGLKRSTHELRFMGSWPRAVLDADGRIPPAGHTPPDYAESKEWVRQLLHRSNL
ncbi:prephenate dehydratase [Corynebacterium anserum]|uniref:Prephenate dehydratase n=1 Tax=Corynebacterium anserum TaxID=2684406 RepID=A0A7G7YLL3_9CORY|nr:prephenate dehydratase [Corynebacterium anserum]MBC2681459.1 prephenate dehydratase [Corynebacterium anserum]QNH95383.1 prephenate dehydratase [Corynebacterium anserum]